MADFPFKRILERSSAPWPLRTLCQYQENQTSFSILSLRGMTSPSKTESSAFERAQLESKRIRILRVLAVVAIFIVVTLVRVFVIRSVSGKTSSPGK
jgi:hypothetical protein